MFIVLEGIDGCGKSTQAKLLYDWILSTGRKVELTAEPTREKVGNFVRELLSSGDKIDPRMLALLFTADRSDHLKNFIEPNLSKGRIVISERYYHSTIAYQSSQGIDTTWLFQINSFAVRPDLTIFIDVTPEIAVKNIMKKIDGKKQTIEKRMAELNELKEKYSREASKYHMRMYDSYIRKDPAKIAGQPIDTSVQNINRQIRNLTKEIETIENELNRERTNHMKFEKFENLVGFGEEDYAVFLRRVYDNYKKLADMTYVDGNQPVGKVFEDIRVIVSKVLR